MPVYACGVVARRPRLAPLDLFWWEEPTTGEREELTNAVAAECAIPVATGEQYDKVGKFLTLAMGGGVSIFQPEPMSLGGITNTIAVANIARANGAWIAPHQSGGPVATAVCLQLAACVPNFLIQEHFDPFNDPWTRDLVTWTPAINPENGASLPSRRAGARAGPELGRRQGTSLRSQRLSRHASGRLGEATGRANQTKH